VLIDSRGNTVTYAFGDALAGSLMRLCKINAYSSNVVRLCDALVCDKVRLLASSGAFVSNKVRREPFRVFLIRYNQEVYLFSQVQNIKLQRNCFGKSAYANAGSLTIPSL